MAFVKLDELDAWKNGYVCRLKKLPAKKTPSPNSSMCYVDLLTSTVNPSSGPAERNLPESAQNPNCQYVYRNH